MYRSIEIQVSKPFDTEPANRERSKCERLLRRAEFSVAKGLDGYDFSNVRLPAVASPRARCAIPRNQTAMPGLKPMRHLGP